MGELSQADEFLLKGIRQGDSDAWSQLVDRHRGRLVAFAQSRLRGGADAEDIVQETFMAFLKGVEGFRGEAGLETYLFTILRRRLVDFFRGRRASVCLLHDVVRPHGPDEADEPFAQVASPDPTASVYARRGERDELRRRALAEAVRTLVNAHKKALKFRELKIVEMLFYCQLANKEVAGVAGVGEKRIALIKHRCLKKVRQDVERALGPRRADFASDGGAVGSEAMLTGIWETLRLSCPKRSTIGAYLLGTLDEAWRDYVDFHLHKLGCRFCLANLADLERQDGGERASAFRKRILDSTVGFLRQSYLGAARRR